MGKCWGQNEPWSFTCAHGWRWPRPRPSQCFRGFLWLVCHFPLIVTWKKSQFLGHLQWLLGCSGASSCPGSWP